MAVLRDQPYGNYNFLVDLGDGNSEGPRAGFSEVILPEVEIEVIEYRSGNARESGAAKLPGRVKYGNLTLKRGVIGALDLFQWVNQVRNGEPGARRNVAVHLQNEDRTEVVMTWKFLRAWPAKYSGPTLAGLGNAVAIDTLQIAFERLEIE
ncbi:MAG: phage tail protein [Betaproteobacteria bacterium]|nr:phage tail protein [Betaproteobacteria bacterium]